MAGIAINVRIEGLAPLLKKLDDPRVLELAQQHMLKACIFVRDDAAVRAPVDTGRLRSSLTFGLGKEMHGITGVVGSPVQYAPHMEYGTGRLTDYPGGGKGYHHPPGAALDVWASRHGFASGAIVARIIAKRGGLRPRRFLRDAFAAKTDAIKEEMGKLLDDVIEVLKK